MAVATVDQENAQIHTLPNGLTVLLEHLPHVHSASIGVWVRTGSAHEQPHEWGLAHFLEHLFFKGTTTRSVHEVMAAIEGRGGQLNAYTARDHTCLYAKVLGEHVPIGIEILADIVRNPTFADLERERGVILEEIVSIEDTPDEWVLDLSSEQHWPNHPLGRSITGTTESVSALALDHVQQFFEAWYRPENLFVSIAGNFELKAALPQIEDEFGAIDARPTPAGYDRPTFRGGPAHHSRDIAQAHLAMAFPGPALDDPARFACDMTASVLGGGSTSRLFERIREEEGLAYSVFTHHAFHHHAGMLGVYAGVAPHNLDRTLEITYEELRRIRDERVPQDEMELNRAQIRGGLLMSLESTFARMGRMARSMMHHGRIVPVDEVLERLDNVTVDDVQAYAQQAFTADQCALTVLGPHGDAPIETIAL